MDQLVQTFFEEAAELVADFEARLLDLEGAPADAELLNRIFRSAHTLKGNSAMLGFEDITHFTHALEDLLDQLRKGQRGVTPKVVDALLASGDAVRTLLARARAGGPAVDEETTITRRVLTALRTLASEDDPVSPSPTTEPRPAATPEPGGRMLYEIEVRPPLDTMRRGLDPLRLVLDVCRLGEAIRVTTLSNGLPALAQMDPEQTYLGWRIWLLSGRPRAEIEACFELIGDPAALRIETLDMGDTSGPAPAESTAGFERRRAVAVTAAAESASIRVPVEKVDRLIDLVGELVITQSMVAQTVAAFTPAKLPALREAVAQMDRHARELHERMMGVRMVPIKTLLGRFPRLVRDLASVAGKQVMLEVSGEDTELDKSVIEKIGDSLTHLVRNAVDHGIEPPEHRRSKGKSTRGRIALKAYQRGGNIFIDVEDDGGGLDREKIRAKAVTLALAGSEEALTDEQIFGLIFRPGFSTAERVTEMSGRGVGMDVVRQNVEALGGAISIQSATGQGTIFRIKLPLTLAILDGQLVRVGDQTFVLPLVAIVESVRPRREQLNRILAGAETLTIRGRVLPVLRLHEVFAVTPQSREVTAGLMVIIEQDGHQVALLVDELLAQHQVVIKSLETNFERVRGVAGATILGDGHVTLILDVAGLLALAREGVTPVSA